MGSRQFRHSLRRRMEMWINPRIRFIEPDAEVPVLTPARRGGRDGLLGGMLGEKFCRRGELKIFVAVVLLAGEAKVLLAVGHFAKQPFEKYRPLKPPVPEQLGIEWRHDDRIEIERAKIVELLPPRLEKMRGMRVGHAGCGRRLIKFFLAVPIGDAVVFDAGEFSQRQSHARPEMFERKL